MRETEVQFKKFHFCRRFHQCRYATRVPYLGCEVPVEYALTVQVLQSSGDIQRQSHPDSPRQIQVTVQQLLQVTPVYVLHRKRR